MLSIKTNGTQCCDGLTRKEFLRIGGLGFAGLSLPQLLQAQPLAGNPKAKRCIVLFMTGGPPQQDTFDMKPEASGAPRGEFKPIKTNVPGIEISEMFPMLAQQADKYCIIRSVTHDSNIHTVGAHYMLTGNALPRPAAGEVNAAPTDFPNLGCVVSKLAPNKTAMPTHVVLPQRNTNTDGTVWPGVNAGFLGARYDPLFVMADYDKWKQEVSNYQSRKFRTPALEMPAGVTTDRLDTRRKMLSALEGAVRSAEKDATVGLLDHYRSQALDLITSPQAQRAFNLDLETASVRDRYGRHIFGEGCLLARRLVQAGVKLATVYWHVDGNTSSPSWDTHESHYKHLKERLMSPCDRAYSALLEDLHRQGMLEDTLVVWMGEFGRTPQINGAGGRDHWGALQSIVMAGGGVKGGQVYGKSDKIAAYPEENPVSPGDIAATIYQQLGLDLEANIVDQTGRPHPLVRGEPIQGIL
jgi:hypothetical protein